MRLKDADGNQLVIVDGRFSYKWPAANPPLVVGDLVKVDGRNAGSHFTGTVSQLGVEYTGEMKWVVENLTPRKFGTHIQDKKRRDFGGMIKHAYEVDGMSVRDIANQSTRSYGFIYKLLKEMGTKMRPQGGARR